MQKWEYAHWFEAYSDLKAKPMLFKLMPDSFGRDGWELVSVSEWPVVGNGVAGLLYYFKRPLPTLLGRLIATLSLNAGDYQRAKTKDP